MRDRLISVLFVTPVLAEQPVIRSKNVQKQELNRPSATTQIKIHQDKLNAQLKKLDATLSKLRNLLHQPIPKTLDKKDQKEWHKHSAWLKKLTHDLLEQRQKLQTIIAESKDAQRKKITGKEQQDLIRNMNIIYTEFLALQKSMQMKSQEYQLISNILQARHASAMSAIRNMR